MVLQIFTSPVQQYRANPTDVSNVYMPKIQSKNLVLIFHGAGGLDRETSQLSQRFAQQDDEQGIHRDVVLFEWKKWLGPSNRAAFDAQSVGTVLGKQLAGMELDSLHIVGTSVGGFAADACTTAFVKSSTSVRCDVHLTLTDPFTSRGTLGEGWGIRNFGRYADFAEQIMNTDDFVPSTNEPCELCYCVDVTRSKLRREFRPPFTGNIFRDASSWLLLGHNWPMGYLSRTYQTRLDGEGAIILPSHEEFPRGKVVEVD